MNKDLMSSQARSHLSQIPTNAEDMQRAKAGCPDAIARLVSRYSKAIARYLLKLESHDDAQAILDLVHDLFLNGKFKGWDPSKGRFRFYLVHVIRNVRIKYSKRQSRTALIQGELLLDAYLGDEAEQRAVDDEARMLREEWVPKTLEKALQRLKDLRPAAANSTVIHFLVSRGNLSDPDAETLGPVGKELAKHLEQQTGKIVTEKYARQLIHRAREKFAEMLYAEVEASIPTRGTPTHDLVVEELADLGLWEIVKNYVKYYVKN